MAHLTDDGTLDTVITCDICGAEVRYHYDPQFDEGETAEETARNAAEAYDAFVAECIADVDASCVFCAEDEGERW